MKNFMAHRILPQSLQAGRQGHKDTVFIQAQFTVPLCLRGKFTNG